MTVEVAGLLLAALVGLSLGLLGGGGSILAVPILVYVVGMGTKPAIAMSLLVVGATSLAGALQHARARNVDLRTAALFGAVSMAGAYAGGRAAAFLPDWLQLTLLAATMLSAAAAMFRSRGMENEPGDVRMPLVVIAAAGSGILTGIAGAGGGFLIVPALVLFAGVAMKRAVGTSLVVIAMNSAAGFAAYAGTVPIDATYAIAFTAIAIGGSFAGAAIVPRVSQASLRRAFAAFLVVVAGIVLAQSLVPMAQAAIRERQEAEAR